MRFGSVHYHTWVFGIRSDVLGHSHVQPVTPDPISGTGQALSRNPENPRHTRGCLSAGYLDTGFRRYDGLRS